MLLRSDRALSLQFNKEFLCLPICSVRITNTSFCMGINTTCKVSLALPAVTTFLLIIVSLPASTISFICNKGQYHDNDLQTCMNCTRCDLQKNLVTLQPCEVHRDTVCVAYEKFLQYIQNGNKHRHHHRHRNHNRTPKLTTEIFSVTGNGGIQTESIFKDVATTEAPFNSMETLVWDWQAVALTFAVFSCILFFLVIALYSMHQAKQWKRLKDNFEADVEDLSARLSLMAASCNENGDVLEPTFGPIKDDGDKITPYMYLNKLLQVRKDKRPGVEAGNVYIDETNPNGKT